MSSNRTSTNLALELDVEEDTVGEALTKEEDPQDKAEKSDGTATQPSRAVFSSPTAHSSGSTPTKKSKNKKSLGGSDVTIF